MFASKVLLGQNETAPKQSQVRVIEIKGNKTFSNLVLKNQIATQLNTILKKIKFWKREGHPLNKIRIKKNAARIREFYNQHGFVDARVDYKIVELDERKVKVVFKIDEGKPITIQQIKFKVQREKYQQLILEDETFLRAQKKSSYKKKKRFEPAKKVSEINRYEKALKNIGFAFANVLLNAAVDTAAKSAVLTFEINSGPQTVISNIEINGSKTVSNEYIVRQSGLKKGSLYSLKAIKAAQRRLLDHPLFKFVTIRVPPQDHDSTLTLLINIREKKLRAVELSAGFSTEEYLRGRVSWIHRNAFDKAHRFSITAKASFIEQFFGLDYLFPYAFNPKSSFLISPFAQHLIQPGYELYQWGITNSFIYRHSRDLTATASYRFTRNDEVSRQSNINLPDSIKMYNLSSIQISGLYNRGLRMIERGWVIRPSAQVSGLLGTSDFQFQKLTLDIRRYFNLTNSTKLALRVQGGKIFAAKEDSLPRSVRLYLGGANSVRGWGRNELSPKTAIFENKKGNRVPVYAPGAQFKRFIPIGGRTSFAFNIEIRQNLYHFIPGAGFVLFLDGGQVWRRAPDVAERPLQFGTGGGLRYHSPIGPVRLDLAYKLNPSRTDLDIFENHDYGNIWNRFGLYISIGQAF